MSEGKLTCYKCESTENVYKLSPRGLRGICRPCNTAKHKAWRANGGMRKQYEAVMRYNAKNKQRVRAWTAVNLHLTKKPCEICGSENVHAHHDRPEMTLDVIWLCPVHHKKRHVFLKSLETA